MKTLKITSTHIRHFVHGGDYQIDVYQDGTIKVRQLPFGAIVFETVGNWPLLYDSVKEVYEQQQNGKAITARAKWITSHPDAIELLKVTLENLLHINNQIDADGQNMEAGMEMNLGGTAANLYNATYSLNQ